METQKGVIENVGRDKKTTPTIIFVILLFLIYLSNFYSFLLFHTVSELFSITIAFGIFAIGWNTRKNIESFLFLILGVSLVFIGSIDLLHTLAYKGMNIFIEYNANLPTQLWIAARYIQAGSFLFAFLFMYKKISPNYLVSIYALITTLIIISIFMGIFPTCYIEGSGLTPFKIISEYVIVGILFISILILYQKREEFNLRMFRLMSFSIITTIIAELSFTFYIGVYDLSNLIGHLLKIISFYLIYLAIIQKGLGDPTKILFTKLKQSEETLKQKALDLEKAYSNVQLSEHNLKERIKELRCLYRISRLFEKPIFSFKETIRGVLDLLPPAWQFPEITCARIKYRNNKYETKNFKETEWVLSNKIIINESLFEMEVYYLEEKPFLTEESDLVIEIGKRLKANLEQRRAEEDLYKEKKFTETALNAQTDTFFVFDPLTKRAIRWNKAFKEVSGYTDEEILSMDAPDSYYSKEDLLRAEEATRHVETEGITIVQMNLINKDGSQIPFEYIGSSITDENGNLKYIVSVGRNITERKKAEEQIKYQAKLVEDVSDAIISTDLDFNIISFNKAAEDIYGWRVEEVIGKKLGVVVPTKYISETSEEAIIEEFMKQGFWKGEVIQINRNNEELYVLSSVSIIRDSKGNPIGAVGLNRDITERRLAQEEIKNLAKFPSENPNPVLRVNREDIIYSNQSGQDLFHIEIGSKIPQNLKSATEEAFRTLKLIQIELEIDNEFYSLILTPVPEENYLNIYGLKITKRKKAEQRIKNMVSTVSHELRTPISVLLMSLELVKQKGSNITAELQEKLIETEERNISLLKDLSEDLLTISQIDEKRLELELVDYQLVEFLKDILTFFAPFGQEKNISFSLNIDNSIHLKVDTRRFDQVFRILLDNAIKYSHENTIIELTAIDNYQGKYNPKGTKGVLIQIEDHGIGISKQDLPHIFERFYRASNVKRISGTGLGLSIAKELVQLHEGEIYIESEIGQGTTFLMFFPKLNSLKNNV
jgi:PAS domain S-box-containing protein